MTLESPPAEAGPALHRFSWCTAAAAFALILAGGLVTSTGSGLAVPDWPLSYGQFFPPMKGGVFFEHGHRLIAGAVGVLAAALAFWVHLREPRRWVRRLALAALGLILLQAFLGGVTVLYGLPPQVSIFHACLGQTIFCLLAVLAEAASPAWRRERQAGDSWLAYPPVIPARLEDDVGARGGRPLKILCLAAVAAAFAQLVLGAVIRHTGTGLWLHVAGAWAASLVLAALSAWILSGHGGPRLVGPSMFIMGALTLQILLGAAAASIRSAVSVSPSPARVAFATAHVGCGALLLALASILTLRAYRPRLP